MRASTAGSLRQANENYHEESATVPAPLPQWPIAKGAGFAPSASGYATGLRERLDLPCRVAAMRGSNRANRSEEHTSELQSLMRISYAVFCLKKKTQND